MDEEKQNFPNNATTYRIVKRCKIDNKCYIEFSDCEIEDEYFCISIKLDVLDYNKIRGGYVIKLNIEEIDDELELIIDVDKILNDIDNTCAKFLVEKYVNLLCELNKGVVFMKVRDSNYLNSSKLFIMKTKVNY